MSTLDLSAVISTGWWDWAWFEILAEYIAYLKPCPGASVYFPFLVFRIFHGTYFY